MRGEARPHLSPEGHEKHAGAVNREGFLLIMTIIFLLPVAISVVCDFSINRSITWSGYVFGGCMLLYIFVVPRCASTAPPSFSWRSTR
jgi:hypothetical protein